MDPISIALLGGGLLAKAFNKTPDFNPLTGDYGVHGDYSYNAGTDYGQGTAAENMGRYGFQGVYQKYLNDTTEQLKTNEMRRIQKLASGLTPGQASLRGGVASQGVNGSTSNVIARQQREQGLTKALDTATSAGEASNARLDSQLMQMTGQNEAMRFGASQDLMRATGQATEAGNRASEFNANMRSTTDRFNASQRFQQDSYNNNGRFQADKMQFDKWNDIFGDVASIGSTMFGQEYAKMLNGPSISGSDADFLTSGGWKSDGRGGYDWSAPVGSMGPTAPPAMLRRPAQRPVGVPGFNNPVFP